MMGEQIIHITPSGGLATLIIFVLGFYTFEALVIGGTVMDMSGSLFQQSGLGIDTASLTWADGSTIGGSLQNIATFFQMCASLLVESIIKLSFVIQIVVAVTISGGNLVFSFINICLGISLIIGVIGMIPFVGEK